MRWTPRKNKIMHRATQWIILLGGSFMLFIVLSDPSYYGFLMVDVLIFSFLIISSIIFLVWAFRIRKLTWEEKIFKQEVVKLEDLKEKTLLSEEEYEKTRTYLFKEYLNKFTVNTRRDLTYKIERLGSLKEEGFISEEEFKQGKAKLIKK